MQSDTRAGSCLCGAVAFEVIGPLRNVIACHCSQCRRWSGHYWAASSVPLDRFRLLLADELRWFRSSPAARRGFCGKCGSSLFWKPEDDPRMSFSPAALDGRSGLWTAEHIHRAEAGDYYRPEGHPPPPDPDPPQQIEAACLCGACAFALPGPAGPITACHCRQCRKLSGHYAASFDAGESTLDWRSRGPLAEYATPGGGRRGFCGACGSSLYFRAADGAFSVEAGAVTGRTGGRLAGHIFTAAKGDYYRIDDDLPQHAEW